MSDPVAIHYAGGGDLAASIAKRLQSAGKNPESLRPEDLASVDEFHIRGRKATLELAERMHLGPASRVLDIGSGLGGPARTLAQACGCHVTGVDLTPAFCAAAETLSEWVGLGERTDFRQGDATHLPFEDNSFDAAMTIHAAMNIPDKRKMYAEARRVVAPGGVFAVYDVLQGEGGEVIFPVPWAREPSISHLATPAETEAVLSAVGFDISEVHDSTEESQAWFEAMIAHMNEVGPPPIGFQVFLGDDFPQMARNQVRNVTERRIRTVSYICVA